MSSSLNLLERRTVATGRATATQGAEAARASPHTPRRNPASTFSSPGSGIRPEEEYVVIELSARRVVAGFAGDSCPKCTLGFTRDESRRVADYRRWLPEHSKFPVLQCKASEWGREHELWQLNLRDVDLGLVEDKLERATRDAFTRFLLQDSKSKRLVLILPSLLPQPILASILTTLFRNSQPPGIVLLPASISTVMGAGQRSGLVVDVGWHETVVTAVYEFRETKCGHTIRALRLVTLAMARMLDQAAKGESIDLEIPLAEDALVQYDFESAEEVTIRLAWCRQNGLREEESPENGVLELGKKFGSLNLGNGDNPSSLQVKIPKSSNPDETLTVPFAALSSPVESILLGSNSSSRSLDDEERTIHILIYEVLTALESDVRSTCMNNIIFTGEGANIPGLRTRILSEVSQLRDARGWDPVWGSAAEEHKLREIDRNPQSTPNNKAQVKKESDPNDEADADLVPAGLAEPPQDKIYEKIRQAAAKDSAEQARGSMRCIESLGSWEGASLATSLKLKGVVEIERESYMQHGLAGAHRDHETHETRSRKSMGATLARHNASDSSTWTLGLWG